MRAYKVDRILGGERFRGRIAVMEKGLGVIDLRHRWKKRKGQA